MLTIVVPVKDRLSELKDTIESIAMQSLQPRELIIVDDGSATPVSADQLPNLHEISVKIIRNDPNIGAAASCNIAADIANEDIICFLDSDDCLDSLYTYRVSKAWEKASTDTVAIVVGFWWCTNDLQPYKRHVIQGAISYERLAKLGNFIGGNSIISVRASAFKRAGGFPLVRGSYDWGLFLRLSRQGRIDVLDAPLVYYRSPSTSLLSNDTKNFRKQILSLFSISKEQLSYSKEIDRMLLSKLVAFNLVQSGRKKLALRVSLFSIRKHGFHAYWLSIWVIALTGPTFYSVILKAFAHARAFVLMTQVPGYFTHNAPKIQV